MQSWKLLTKASRRREGEFTFGCIVFSHHYEHFSNIQIILFSLMGKKKKKGKKTAGGDNESVASDNYSVNTDSVFSSFN